MGNCCRFSCVLAVCSFGQRDVVDYVNTNIGAISHATIPNKLNIQLPYAMMRANVEKYDNDALVIERLLLFSLVFFGRSIPKAWALSLLADT